jgi:hypothetical protein
MWNPNAFNDAKNNDAELKDGEQNATGNKGPKL